MKNIIRNLPIRFKVNAILILMSVIVLAMAMVGFLSIQGFQLKERYRSEFETLTKLTADNLQAALLFDDEQFAQEILRNLQSSSAVVEACIRRQDGSPVAGLGESFDESIGLGEKISDMSSITAPILDEEGHVIGTLEMRFRTDGFRESLERSIRWGIWILLASVLLSIVIARLFHWMVSFPLQKMTKAAIALSQQEHPGRLEGEESKDEIGVLVRAFNGMVAQIMERDRALKEAARLLEARVEERTAQLHVAAEEAKVASKAKSEFLAIISHELRTPLNPILGYTSLLLSNRLGFENKEYVEGIRVEADRMLSLVDRILEFIKVEKGQFECQACSFDLVSLMEHALDQHLASADAVLLNFELGVPGTDFAPRNAPLMVLGDRTMIERVTWNLLCNAVKFTRKGSVTLRLGCREDGPGRLGIRVEVEDTGPGVPESFKDSMFEPFRQLDSSSTRPFGGMGLGLCVSKRLIDAMGGTIGCSNNPGGGACFWYELSMERSDSKKCEK
jgi:two-component system, sensor histidine kinase and response regulator